jgi:polysaccharide pyruvyl transferase WcaK-like protein
MEGVRLNIGVIGWWRHDNQGDFTILDNMTRGLAPHRVVPIDLPFFVNDDTLRRLNLLDFLILGGGGLFQQIPPSPFDTFDQWGQGLQTPIGAAGVGVDSIPDDYRRSVTALVEQARFFAVRDAASQQIVGHPSVRVAPDLTFLYPMRPPAGDGVPLSDRPVCGVNLRQSPGLDAAQWVSTLKKLPVHLRGVPLSGLGVWQEHAILQQLDAECTAAFHPGLYTGLDLMIGTAFHAVVFAVQAAVPTIAIAYAPKVKRFMTDLGLADYVIEPKDWRRLPELVAQLLGQHDPLSEHLRRRTTALSQEMQRAFADMRRVIEGSSVGSSSRSGPWVSAVVIGTNSEAADRSTVASCLDQTYPNVELIYVGNRLPADSTALTSSARVRVLPGDPAESLGACLNRAFSEASGEYLTWTLGGNLYAQDAFACMVDRLESAPDCDMVYTDYYTLQWAGLLADVYPTDAADKLFRRDVIGPSFLYRRQIANEIGAFDPDTPLPAYNYWLRAHAACRLQPMHARLFYALTSNLDGGGGEAERQVRRQWRSCKPRAEQAFWRIVDSDAVEASVVRPLLAARRKVKGTR